MYCKLICILYALLCWQNFILVKSGCYMLLGKILVEGSIVVVAAHFAGSSATVFATTEHLASVSGIVSVACKIGVAAFASAFVVGSSTMA
jgi:hypothetical protein